MATKLSNQAIVERMLAHVRRATPKLAQAAMAPCGSGFDLEDFAVTYPNNELIANVAVAGVPDGVTVVGVTVAATPSASSSSTYCMGVASDSTGLVLPVSVLGASTSPSFTKATVLTGLVVLSYLRDGAIQECTISQSFTVGGP